MLIKNKDDLLALRESYDVEFKKASGKNGDGMLPDSFWQTYSSFANTEGGCIFLGVEEISRNQFNVTGLKDYARIKSDLFSLANNKSKISINLLDNKSVRELNLDGKIVLQIEIPRATRRQRPVYIGKNPMEDSYIRKNEGDYVLDTDSVKRMLAEQVEYSADTAILKGFTLQDLNKDTVGTYRNVYAALNPNHPFIDLSTEEFLKTIGAWGIDRETGNSGITLAGLLMFGNLRAILDERPNYHVDYRECLGTTDENRWSDRITTDFTWSGNLYDFYKRVYQKITADLKVPFRLKQGLRIDETPVHEALREALVNSIIHADYRGRVSILVIKRPEMFSFRNPGCMRVPIERALECGENDCRNKNLQKMFHLIRACEQAGSGIPKIYKNWQQQHWRVPLIEEKHDPDQTVFKLHMVSLLPKEAIEMLDKKFGSKFSGLPELERLILATVVTEKTVNHKRIVEISNNHRSDITKAFSKLSRDGLLITEGDGRGTFYTLSKWRNYPTNSTSNLKGNSEGLAGGNSEGLTGNSEGLAGGNSEGLARKEKEIAKEAKTSKKLPRSKMEEIIIKLCALRSQSGEKLAQLLNRSPEHLRQSYITPMVNSRKISQLHPDPNHPKQAYICGHKEK